MKLGHECVMVFIPWDAGESQATLHWKDGILRPSAAVQPRGVSY